MSSFIVSDQTIGQIAKVLGKDIMEQYEMAERLVRLNVHNVAYYYNLSDQGAALDFAHSSLSRLVSRVKEAVDSPMLNSQSRLLGAVDCFIYNSGDFDGVERDSTFKLVQELQEKLEGAGVVSEGWDL